MTVAAVEESWSAWSTLQRRMLTSIRPALATGSRHETRQPGRLAFEGLRHVWQNNVRNGSSSSLRSNYIQIVVSCFLDTKTLF